MTLLFTTIHEVYPGHFIHALHLHRPIARRASAVDVHDRRRLGALHRGDDVRRRRRRSHAAGARRPAERGAAAQRPLRRRDRRAHRRACRSTRPSNCSQTRAFLDPGNAKQQAIRGTFDPMYLAYTLGKLAIMKMHDDWMAKHPGASLARVPRRVPRARRRAAAGDPPRDARRRRRCCRLPRWRSEPTRTTTRRSRRGTRSCSTSSCGSDECWSPGSASTATRDGAPSPEPGTAGRRYRLRLRRHHHRARQAHRPERPCGRHRCGAAIHRDRRATKRAPRVPRT